MHAVRMWSARIEGMLFSPCLLVGSMLCTGRGGATQPQCTRFSERTRNRRFGTSGCTGIVTNRTICPLAFMRKCYQNRDVSTLPT
jgi:hypothetical protein